jgi:hypothetical protein
MSDELRIEVLKFYPERLRYLVMDEELGSCFDCNSREEFIDMCNITPEQAFLGTYEYWFNMNDDDVWNEICSQWDDEFIESYFFASKESTESIQGRIERKIQEIKQLNLTKN